MKGFMKTRTLLGVFFLVAIVGVMLSGCQGGPINYNTKDGCFQKPYAKYSYQQLAVPGSPAKIYADEIWDECRCKWNANDVIKNGPNVGKKYTDVYNVNPDCSRFKK